MKTSTLALSAAFGTVATTGWAQPADVWSLLDKIAIDERVTETTYEVRKTFPAAMQQGDMEVEISGYAVPALPGEQVRELILVSDMGLCPYCGSADHTSSLQVTLAEAIPYVDENTRISLRGTLSPVTDPETWQSAVLRDARIVAQ